MQSEMSDRAERVADDRALGSGPAARSTALGRFLDVLVDEAPETLADLRRAFGDVARGEDETATARAWAVRRGLVGPKHPFARAAVLTFRHWRAQAGRGEPLDNRILDEPCPGDLPYRTLAVEAAPCEIWMAFEADEFEPGFMFFATEDRADAKAALLDFIAREFDRRWDEGIERCRLSGQAPVPNARRRFDDHCRWLIQYQLSNHTFGEIADAVSQQGQKTTKQNVYNRIHKTAALIGLQPRAPHRGGRPRGSRDRHSRFGRTRFR